MDDVGELLRQPSAIGTALFGDLVADAPHHDAGVIAVAVDELTQVGLVPVLPVFGEPILDFGDLPHVEGLVHHEQAHAVRQFEQLRRGRIVAGADGVHAHPLHDLQLPLQRAAIDGGAERSQIVVHADAVEAPRAAVQQEALVPGVVKCPYAERRHVAVGLPGALADGAGGAVKIRSLEIPAMRADDVDLRFDALLAAGGDGHVVRGAPGLRARRIEDGGLHGDVRLGGALILDLGAYDHRGIGIGDRGSGDVGAPLPDAHGSGDVQPHVAVDAGAGIPARGLILGREAHGQHVLLAELDVRREIEREALIAVGASAQLLAVDPDGGVRHGAIELHAEVLALGAGRHREVLAIPGHAEERQTAVVRADLAVERTLDSPIVGQVERAPGGVVESGLLGAGGFALEEAPVVSDADASVGADLDFGGSRAGGAGERQQQERGCH